MSTDIDYWSDSYRSAIDDADRLVTSLGGCEPDERLSIIDAAESKLKRAGGIKKSYKFELRLLRDRELKRSYEESLRQLDDRREELKTRVEEHRERTERSTLLENTPMAFGEHKGNDYYLDKASSLQDKTENTLERTTQMIEASKEVGASTLSELERQQDQIKDVSADIMLIEDNLSRADRLIRNFTKRMMTDKLIMGFAFLNMCALTGIIIYCVVTGKVLGDDKKKKDESGPDESERRLFLRGSSNYMW